MNQYAPVIETTETVTVNRAALIAIGLSPREADTFADRKYSALPAWLRKRIKATAEPKQDEPRKLNPKAGELAFYINKYAFPIHRVSN